ncbi:hypothetical protein A1O7_00831 [Cladophialophora yegresii CBS 114405]|uniref:Uncharacterized protein n=1 Tax=Cladophialophora yegresii CBS 114405 TaxID=1182544 RepID=W9WHP1_9EURO|nr:uncharacterized protein A1O7_00831 [Cladophialophora yegresii CBS 114405]EXJ64495.1 hypothetical protein A1O7_00831 [Cladophialophora yegresii CBS 114405]
MYTTPGRRVTNQAIAICPSCATRLGVVWRALSSSPTLSAKRTRVPKYVKQATIIPRVLQGGKKAPESTGLRRRHGEKPIYLAPELVTGLQKLGFSSIFEVMNVLRHFNHEVTSLSPATVFQVLTTHERFTQIAEQELKRPEARLMRDPNLLRKAFHLLGRNYFHQQNRQGQEGLAALRAAFLAGEVDAGIDAAAAEAMVNRSRVESGATSNSSTLLSPRLFDFIKQRARARADWRAMTLYLKEISRVPQTEVLARDNYNLARELFDMLEPSKELLLENTQLLRAFEPPWKILHDAAVAYLAYTPEGCPENDKVQADIETALREGIHKYSDPRAVAPALRQQRVIPWHSSEWVDLATQAAAAGVHHAAFDLAMYHLRQGAWRPKQADKKPTDWTGIEWLAVSAALSAPDIRTMVQSRYLGLAHLLREHGYLAEGYAWMQYAKENAAEAGLDPDKEWEHFIHDFELAWAKAEKDDEMQKYIQHSDKFFAPYLDERDK